jgi:hypothetical protein
VHTWTGWSRWSFFKRNILCCSSSNVQYIRYNALTWPVWQSITITNIVDILSSRITSRTFTIISWVVHVDGHPEFLSSSTDSRPCLESLNHLNVLAWLKACSPKASFSIRWISDAVLLSLKQNLMQVLCSLTHAISRTLVKMVLRKRPKLCNTCTYKDASCQTVGWKINKRHLAAQVHITNGLRGIFKFSEILGSTTYILRMTCTCW